MSSVKAVDSSRGSKMKKIVSGIALMLSCTTLMANEYDLLLGLDIGNSEGKFSTPTGNYNTDNGVTYGFKAGVVTEKSRIYFSYHYIDAFENSNEKDGEFQTFALSGEALTDPYNLYSSVDSRFFVGGHVGAINVNLDSTLGSTDTTDLLYGLQGGLLLSFTKNVDLEFGYRYSKSKFSSLNNDLENLKMLYAGFNFTF